MQVAEYHALERVEREHWFYRGKRELVMWWIDRVNDRQPKVILDAGAGTGELVCELSARYPDCQVLGLEFVAEARAIARETKGVELIPGSILDLPFADGHTDLSIALDVLEHVEDDALALRELVRVTHPGGHVIVNVPAFMSLWSEWDVVLGHHRRYTRASLKSLVEGVRNETEVVYLEYANFAAFIPILLYRKIAQLFKRSSRAEDHIPGKRLNALLLKLFLAPSKAVWFHPPFGSSVFCVLKKK